MTLLEDADFAVQLGERLKKTRGIISREDLAARIGVHINTYGNYERGSRVPDASFLRRFCEEFNLNSNWLLTGKEPIHVSDQDPLQFDFDLLGDIIAGMDRAFLEKGIVWDKGLKWKWIKFGYAFFSNKKPKGSAEDEAYNLFMEMLP